LILCRLGLAYHKAEDLNSATHYLRQAVRFGPGYYYPRLGLGYSLLKNGHPDQAAVELETGMRIFPTLEGAFLLAEAYEQQGKSAQAAKLYADVARAQPYGKFGRQASERRRLLKNP
jgi:Tfp pilus assembly protein PilF